LSVHIRPTFFVLSSNAFASCQLFMVTLSAIVVLAAFSAAFTCYGHRLNTMTAAMINTNNDVFFIFSSPSVFIFLLYNAFFFLTTSVFEQIWTFT
jgi:hypothetical protein